MPATPSRRDQGQADDREQKRAELHGVPLENRESPAGSASFAMLDGRHVVRRHRHRRRASPACTSSTGCAGSACACGCSRPATASAAPGTGTATPGARFDSESWTYGYSFSEEILREWEWSEHFAAQPETLRYCNFVADKLDLRRDIEFNCRIKAAAYDEAADQWEIESEDGRRARARFLITAIGPLSAPTMPTIPGVESFRGEAYHTGRWPHEPVSFAGKRVAVIGTGATGGAGDHRDRQDGRPPHGVPAHAELVRAAAQQPDRRGHAGAASRRPTRRSSRSAATPSAASSTRRIRARPSR